jgi:hypothetical protein
MSELKIVCNNCGVLMRSIGPWPLQYPRGEGASTHIAERYACETCKIPHDAFSSPVMISILEAA